MIYYPTTANFIQKTLDAQLLTGITASATLNNVTSIQNKAGVMIIDRVDANGVETPSKVEVISFAGTSGSTVTTLVRALGGTTDQDHEVGAIVEFGPDIVWAQGLIDTMLVQHNEDGTHSTTYVVTPTGTQTLTNKTLTSPKVETAILDANGNEVIKTPATTSAVNEVTITNSATGNAVKIEATGGDTDIDLQLNAKGNGIVKVGTDEIVTLANTKTLINKTLTSPALQGTVDGWISANETWTYASTTTFTVSGDVTGKYQIGDKIKLTQTTVKYFVITAVSYSAPNTTITVFAGTTHTLANASITDNYYSRVADPYGFPSYFSMTAPSFTRSGTGFTNAPSQVIANIAFKGKQAMVMVQGLWGNPSGGTGFIYCNLVPPAMNDSCAMTSGLNISAVKTYSVHHDTARFTLGLYDGNALSDSNAYFRLFLTYQMA